MSSDIKNILAAACSESTVFADLFCEHRLVMSAGVENGRLSNIALTKESGSSLRRFDGSHIDFECREGLSEGIFDELTTPSLPSFATLDEAIHQFISGACRIRYDWESGCQRIQVCNTTGRLARETRSWQRTKIIAGMERNGRHHSISLHTCTPIEKQDTCDEICSRLQAHADAVQKADSLPAKRCSVILPPGLSGVFFHETCGHSLEADAAGSFQCLIGRSVGSKLITLIDDATIPDEAGSIRVDDEGFSTVRRVLIEKGIMKSVLSDWHTAQRKGHRHDDHGNARRESFRYMPLPRMTNLLASPGPDGRLSDIVADTLSGFLAGDLEAGNIDLMRGTFSFRAAYGFVISHGKVVRSTGAVLICGNILDALKNVDRVGCDVKFSQGPSFCLKAGQMIRVGMGAPAIRINELDISPLGFE